MKRYLIIFIISFFLSSCAHVISKDIRKIAVKDVTFKKILKNPDVYVDNVFILGGIIARTTNTKYGTEIEVVQTPIDRFGDIIDKDISEGRFLAITPRQLDPLIYKKDRKITLAGRLIGSSIKLLGELEYSYPLFEINEIYLWKQERYYYIYRPGYTYPYWYDPFYYPRPYYWYDPLWHRPFIY